MSLLLTIFVCQCENSIEFNVLLQGSVSKRAFSVMSNISLQFGNKTPDLTLSVHVEGIVIQMIADGISEGM